MQMMKPIDVNSKSPKVGTKFQCLKETPIFITFHTHVSYPKEKKRTRRKLFLLLIKDYKNFANFFTPFLELDSLREVHTW